MRLENSFIPVTGVGPATERGLWAAGVTHWDAFTPDAVGEKTGRRIAAYIDLARERLDDGDADFFADALPSRSRWRMYENFRDSTAFFDIETTGLSPDRHDVTVVTVHRDGDTRTLVRGRDLTTAALADAFAGATVLVSFNGKRFDVPFLERSFEIDLDRPHIDLMYPCRRADLSGGLKAIERDLGIDRDDPGLSGEDAVRLWREHRRGDPDALETLVRYNRDDTVNMRRVLNHVVDRLTDTIFRSHLPPQATLAD